jgi:ABC-type lipoprotein release transport system permease subunit
VEERAVNATFDRPLCLLSKTRDMLQNFFSSLFRHWWKNKTYSVLNIFGLAIGIACAGLIFLWVEDEHDFDKGNVKMDRLYAVKVTMNQDGYVFTMGSTPRPLAAALKSEIPGIRNAMRFSDENVNALFGFGDRSLYETGRYTDSSLFNMFTLPFVAGNPATAFHQLYSLVLTEKAARKMFGPELPFDALVGKTLRVNNLQDFTVTGILKDLPANSSLQFEWLAPYALESLRRIDPHPWNSYGPLTYVELAPGADARTVDKALSAFIHHKDLRPTTKDIFLFPMIDWRLYDNFSNGKQTGGRIEYVHLLSFVAWIILLIACINFMNLATARSGQRSREIGVRKVLGARRQNLAVRFLLEAQCLALVAAVLAVGIMAWTLPIFNGLVEKQLSLSFFRPIHWLALLGIAACCGLVAGSYPSFYLSSFNPIMVLKSLKVLGGSAVWIRKGLVVLQFSLSIVFIIATITIFRQIQYVKDRNLGFNKDRLIEINMQHPMGAQFPVLRQELLKTGVVAAVAVTDRSTLQGGNTDDRYDWPGKPADLQVAIARRNVTADFVTTTGLRLLAGRDFSSPADSTDILVTATTARLIEGKGIDINYAGVLGKVIREPAGDDKTVFQYFTVAGVVDDYVYGNVYDNPGPLILSCKTLGQGDDNKVYVRTRAGTDPGHTLAKIEAVVQALNTGYPFQYAFVDDQFNAKFKTEELMAETARIFAILAIFISCLGLFGLAAFTAEQRTREIGIRKVLGATVAGITGMLSKDFLWLVALSCLIAFPVAGWLAHNWLQRYTYRIALDGWIFFVAGGLGLVIAWLTIGIHAIRAALANPVIALRNE